MWSAYPGEDILHQTSHGSLMVKRQVLCMKSRRDFITSIKIQSWSKLYIHLLNKSYVNLVILRAQNSPSKCTQSYQLKVFFKRVYIFPKRYCESLYVKELQIFWSINLWEWFYCPDIEPWPHTWGEEQNFFFKPKFYSLSLCTLLTYRDAQYILGSKTPKKYSQLIRPAEF